MFWYILFQTSYTTAIALYYLAKNPDKQQKLFEEILRHLPDKDQPVTSDILNELKYLKACFKESMRYQSKLTSRPYLISATNRSTNQPPHQPTNRQSIKQIVRQSTNRLSNEPIQFFFHWHYSSSGPWPTSMKLSVSFLFFFSILDNR
jgi:hypothetical protein